MPPKKIKSIPKRKSGSTPIPSGPGCGHCCEGASCRVRHVGPTSQMRDHHALHASRSASHVWMAVIVTGVATVLTGALALSGVGAYSVSAVVPEQGLIEEIRRLNNRLDTMEEVLSKYTDACTLEAE